MVDSISNIDEHMASLCELSELDDSARALLRPEQTAVEFVQKLIECGNFEAAIALSAQALAPPLAVAWAVRCIRKAYGDKVPESAGALLDAAERWAKEPGEQNRRAAHSATETAEPGTAGYCVALAAFFSGGSLAPSGLAAVPVPAGLCGRMVRFAIMLAAVVKEPQYAEAKRGVYANQGLELLTQEQAGR